MYMYLHFQKFLWVKFNEVRVFWPVKVLEQSESDDTVQVYVKSDDA